MYVSSPIVMESPSQIVVTNVFILVSKTVKLSLMMESQPLEVCKNIEYCPPVLNT